MTNRFDPIHVDVLRALNIFVQWNLIFECKKGKQIIELRKQMMKNFKNRKELKKRKACSRRYGWSWKYIIHMKKWISSASNYAMLRKIVDNKSQMYVQKQKLKQLANHNVTLVEENKQLQLKLEQFVQNVDIEARECVLCHDRPATVAAVPCGHRCFCTNAGCYAGVGRCPLCRTPMTDTLRIF
jgi:hypothetical protein